MGACARPGSKVGMSLKPRPRHFPFSLLPRELFPFPLELPPTSYPASAGLIGITIYSLFPMQNPVMFMGVYGVHRDVLQLGRHGQDCARKHQQADGSLPDGIGIAKSIRTTTIPHGDQ